MVLTILLTDDDRGIRRFCKDELEADGFRVVLAQDGEEAMSVLDDQSVDVAVLDVHMQVCSGIETARHIRRVYPHLPLILYTLDTDFERYRSPVIDRCVIKSADLDELKEAIHEVVSAASDEARASRTPASSGWRRRAR